MRSQWVDMKDIGSLLDDSIAKGERVPNGRIPKIEELEEDIAKSLSHNPFVPHIMGMDSPYYNPYHQLSDGSFAPHSVEHWAERGKDPNAYITSKNFFRDSGVEAELKREREYQDLQRTITGRFRSLSKSVDSMIKVEPEEHPHVPKIKDELKSRRKHKETSEATRHETRKEVLGHVKEALKKLLKNPKEALKYLDDAAHGPADDGPARLDHEEMEGIEADGKDSSKFKVQIDFEYNDQAYSRIFKVKAKDLNEAKQRVKDGIAEKLGDGVKIKSILSVRKTEGSKYDKK